MKRDWCDKPFRTLVTLGESTTAGGWASCRQRSWPELLAAQINDLQRTPLHLLNMGIGANVISTNSPCYGESNKPAADERLDKHVIAHKPDLLVIAYGLNDARGGTPIDQFQDAMRAIIERVREAVQPLILLPGPYFMTDFTAGGEAWTHADLPLFYKFNDAIAQVAEQTDCLYADLLASYRDAPWLVNDDGVHANDVGHRIVANKMFEVLASNCSGIAAEAKDLESHIPFWREDQTLKKDYGY